MTIEAMKQALEALEFFNETAICSADTDISNEAITSLRQAIAEAEKQEHGNPEDMYIEMHKHLNCPHCGGSGHIDDVAEKQEPVALKKGECWPEEVMKQWDYWRKEIANGHTGSAPRDWFEGLSELKLIDTHPQPKREPLTDEMLEQCPYSEQNSSCKKAFYYGWMKAEAAHNIKGEA